MTKGKFPNGLLDAMNAKNIGVTELGNLLGEPKQNILRWRDEERRLKPEMAAKIAPFLGVTAAQLLLLPIEAPAERQAELQGKDERMEADALSRLRSALIAYGVHKNQLKTLMPLIDTFVKKEVPAQSEQNGSRDQSLPATPRHVKAP